MLVVRVTFLGPARDWLNAESLDLDLPDDATLESARAALSRQSPVVARGLTVARLAVNDRFAPPEHPLRAGDEVLVIPPVSGGEGDTGVHVALTREIIDVSAVRRFVDGDTDCGGAATFDGVVRAESDPAHGKLLRLDYEAHERMALTQMRRLCDEARERFGARRAAIVHRIGAIAVGEVSVSIAVACPHRDEAFAACRFLIDTLKQDVPIWKRDVFADGFIQWTQPPTI